MARTPQPSFLLCLLLFATATLGGCVGGTGMTIAIHGNFCGPNHPRLPAHITDREAAHQYLASVEPIDDLDRECKRHDMCYASSGSHHHICDVRIRSALARFDASFGCKARALNIRAALFVKPTEYDVKPGVSERTNVALAQSTTGTIRDTIVVVALAPAWAVAGVAQVGTEICNGSFNEAEIAKDMAEDRRVKSILYGDDYSRRRGAAR